MPRSFRERVLEVVRAIPKGSVLSYANVAKMAGSPRAFRAVGSIMKANFDPTVPCHRVVRSNGKVGQYNRGDAKKAQLLKEEGAIQ